MIVTETTFRPLDRVIVDETRTALYVRPANGRHLVALLLPSERVDRSVIVTGDRLSTRQAITARRRLMAMTDLDTS